MSFPRYPQYKDSGVEWLGDIPAHWDVKRNRVLFEIKKRIAGKLGYDVLSITQRGIRIKDTQSNEGQLSQDYSNYQLVEPGQFAMNHMDLLTGFVDLSPFHGVTSPDYRVFDVRSNALCDTRYLLYLLQNGYRRSIFYAFGQGSSHLGRWRLPTQEFNEFRMPVPPQAEQRSISEFLDHETAKIDVLIQEQQRLIELLYEKRQAVISHAVTKGLDPTVPMKESGLKWIGLVPSHWKLAKLKHVVQLIDGDRTSAYPSDKDFVDDGIPFLSSKDIEGGQLTLRNARFISKTKFDSLSRGKTRTGDVIITVRGTIGNAALFDAQALGYETAFINAQMMIARPTAVSSTILISIMRSNYWDVQTELASYGTAQQQLSQDVLGNAIVLVPPIEEARGLVAHISKETERIEEMRKVASHAITLLQERRSALIAAAVAGKIDIRNYAPQHTPATEELYAPA